MWRMFGVALGVVVYAVTAGLAIRGRPRMSIVAPILAALMIFVTLALIRTLRVRVFALIQLAPCLEAISSYSRRHRRDLPAARAAGAGELRRRRVTGRRSAGGAGSGSV
ncbi:hypothetical protein GCM10027589_07350 [Actinocorallia lasiicapitis]